MVIEDFIIDGKLDEAKIKSLRETVPYKSEIIWGKDDYRQTKYTFENGMAYAEDNENTKLVFAQDGRIAHFRKDNSLECLQEPDDSGLFFREDGKTKQRRLFADGAQIGFDKDGETPTSWLADRDATWFVFPSYYGRLLSGQDAESLRVLVPLIRDLCKTELPMLSIQLDKNNFINELRDFDETSLPPVPDGYHAVYDPCCLDDNEIDKDMRNIGIKIHRYFEDAFVCWDEEQKKKVYRNAEGEIFTPKIKSSSATVQGTEVTIHTCRFLFSKKDYLRMQKIEQRIQKAMDDFDNVADKYYIKRKMMRDLSDRDYSLFIDYNSQHDIKKTLYHEEKHIKNHLLCDHRAYASDYQKPSEEGDYLIELDNERTATLEPLAKAVAEYLEKGDYKDFSFFLPDMSWVALMLRYKTESEIKKICYPPIKLMNKMLKDWNDILWDDYLEQFKQGCEGRTKLSLLAEDDKNNEEVKKQRRLMYTFEVYNPYKGKKEILDMSELLDIDVKISEKITEEVLKPCGQQRQKEQEKMADLYQDNEGKILIANLAEAIRRSYINSYLQKTKDSGVERIMQDAKSAVPVKKGICNRLVYRSWMLFRMIKRKFVAEDEPAVTLLKSQTADMLKFIPQILKKHGSR